MIVKITINTKEDSHDDIKKVIRMLQHLIEGESFSNVTNSRNIFEQSGSFGGEPVLESSEPSENQPTNAFSAMFGGDAPTVVAEENQDEDTEEPENSDVELTSY